MSYLTINSNVKAKSKYGKLFLCLFLDFVGYLSYTLPFLGEFSDVIWAPFAAFLIARIFKGTVGKISGVVTFIEEIMPGLDFIPTFTITWIYSTFIKRA